MAAVARRRSGPPPPHSPLPLKIRPQCGGHVVTFDGDALGFSVIDVNGVPVVSEAPLSAGFEVGDRLVCVNGARLPRLPSWKVKALFEACGRPVHIEFIKKPLNEGFELDDVTRPLAHVEVSKMLHDATRLQPPFCRDLCGNHRRRLLVHEAHWLISPQACTWRDRSSRPTRRAATCRSTTL